MCCTKELTVSGVERFPGELDTLRADNVRLRRLLQLSEEQARAAASDQATLTGAPDAPVTMGSSSAAQRQATENHIAILTSTRHR